MNNGINGEHLRKMGEDVAVLKVLHKELCKDTKQILSHLRTLNGRTAKNEQGLASLEAKNKGTNRLVGVLLTIGLTFAGFVTAMIFK